MDANLLLWIGQIVLAFAFAVFGYGHWLGFERLATQPRSRWVTDVGKRNMAVIGILEILAAIGLILPAASGFLPWLTPLAAAAIALLMVCAAVFHGRRQGEGQNIVLNVILGVVAALVAYGRFVLAPL